MQKILITVKCESYVLYLFLNLSNTFFLSVNVLLYSAQYLFFSVIAEVSLCKKNYVILSPHLFCW